jgi:hypothetical protein
LLEYILKEKIDLKLKMMVLFAKLKNFGMIVDLSTVMILLRINLSKMKANQRPEYYI